MHPVLVSACLLGEACRYDDKARPCQSVLDLARRREVVTVCPEQLGGLPTPRSASEIDASSPDVRVVSAEGEDRTEAFLRGAAEAVGAARAAGCTVAVLKSKSPSCGCHAVYDGTFSGTLIAGCGVAAAALADAGIRVMDEDDLERDGLDESCA